MPLETLSTLIKEIKVLLFSGRAKRETAKGRNRTRNAHFRRFLQILADFRLAL